MAIDDNLMNQLTTVISDKWSKRLVMPTLATREIGNRIGQPAAQGESVTITDIQPMAAVDVVPAVYPGTIAPINPVGRELRLKYFKSVSIELDFHESGSVVSGTVENIVQTAVDALCEAIDESFFQEMAKYAYQTVGSAGTTPFASNLDDVRRASSYLDAARVPRADGNRFVVLDPWAYNNLSYNANFIEAGKAGAASTILTGGLSESLGFRWYNSQNVPVHSSNTGNVATDGGASAGSFTVAVDNGSDALSNVVVGDSITFAGHTQEYAVTSISNTATEQILTIFPALAVTVANNVVVTRKASHTLNYAFHRSAIQFASRPPNSLASMMRTTSSVSVFIEEQTQIPLSIQFQEAFAKQAWSIMCLWGVSVTPRKENGIVRIMGQSV